MSDVRVNDMEEEDGGLMPLGIGAIVVGCLGALVLIVVLLYLCFCRRNQRHETSTSSHATQDPCCWCWGGRRVIVVHKRDKSQMAIVEKTKSQKVRDSMSSYSTVEKAPSVHTLPVYLRGQHFRPWVQGQNTLGYVRQNGSTTTMPRTLMGPTQRRATMVSGNGTMPTAYLQKGGSLKLTTTKGDMPSSILNGNASVITPATEQETGGIAIATNSMPETPPRATTASQLYPTLSPFSPLYRSTSPVVPMPTTTMAATEAGSQFGYDVPSATINVLPPEGGLGIGQSYSLDPYSLVENPVGENQTVYAYGSGVNANAYM